MNTTRPSPRPEPIYRTVEATAVETDPKRRLVRGIMGDDSVDRHGTVIDPLGIDYQAYLSVPCLLWEHGQDSCRGRRPVGQCRSIEAASYRGRASLIAEHEFADDSFS